MRLKLGLQTILGLGRRGFFIPYGAAENVDGHEQQSYSWIKAAFDARRDDFAAFLARIDAHADALLAIKGLKPPQPRFEQDWFPRLDAAAHYTMVREQAPKRIIEIGSGHSTRFMARALADGDLTADVTAIDPHPRADISKLPVKLVRRPLQDTDRAPFTALQPGDFLCIDSSHVYMPGTDVEVLINHILPQLPAGVFVFVHDIFLPDAYPPNWQPTGYNEQNAIATLLQGPYEPVFASAYAATYMTADVDKTVLGKIPLHPGGIENGLWLRKTG
ncbi:MAG: class I SAM-dependent methyltransferase [Rhizobiales bacterium]|nr:class I SAM-dependent methyltransferase [Hyphomicrobiales bacterium]